MNFCNNIKYKKNRFLERRESVIFLIKVFYPPYTPIKKFTKDLIIFQRVNGIHNICIVKIGVYAKTNRTICF